VEIDRKRNQQRRDFCDVRVLVLCLEGMEKEEKKRFLIVA
jgi:hypothetical protein